MEELWITLQPGEGTPGVHDHHLDAEVAAHDASVSERNRLSGAETSSVSGPGSCSRGTCRQLPPSRWTSAEPPTSTPCRCRAWLPGPMRGFLDEFGFEAIVERESEPSLLETSAHLLAVAHRSG